MEFDHTCSDTSKIIREVILPRLDCYESELKELRAATWPVCQMLKDSQLPVGRSMPFRNIEDKKRFFKFLDPDEIRNLLRLKARYARIDEVAYDQEFRMVRGS